MVINICKKYANVNYINQTGILATIKGYSKIVNALMAANSADVNYIGEDSNTALIIATWNRNLSIVNTLLASVMLIIQIKWVIQF